MKNTIKLMRHLSVVLFCAATAQLNGQAVFYPVTSEDETVKSVAFEVDSKSEDNFITPTSDKGLLFFDRTEDVVKGPEGKEVIWKISKLNSDLEVQWSEEVTLTKSLIPELTKKIHRTR